MGIRQTQVKLELGAWLGFAISSYSCGCSRYRFCLHPPEIYDLVCVCVREGFSSDNTGEQINFFLMVSEISQLILAGFWSHMPK